MQLTQHGNLRVQKEFTLIVCTGRAETFGFHFMGMMYWHCRVPKPDTSCIIAVNNKVMQEDHCQETQEKKGTFKALKLRPEPYKAPEFI
ncbi:hypothetical protein Y1Q_0020039 [Alligator mississippiensis]|uniref:Uncharacterized protein n=1 Tax=Alligator mississippiensis TaxID=8496 RepID=A0A151LYW0_ALLMI|nr:hypothetical protein Y1Q_0020039 [Alligator mississippiensis]